MGSKHKKQDWVKRVSDLPDKLEEYRTPDEKQRAKAKKLPQGEEARQALVERIIQEAMDEGKFDNLPGKGKPLVFEDNPYLESGQQWAYGLLKRNGFAPEWIERDKAIRTELASMRERLQRAWQYLQVSRGDELSQIRWKAAVAHVKERLEELNRDIDDFNLVVPVLSAQRRRVCLEDELRRAKEQPDSSDSSLKD